MISEKFKTYFTHGLGMGMGTRDADLKPEFTRVLGGYVVDDDHVTLFIDEPTSTQALENIRDNQMMSVVMVHIAKVESYQMKGKFTHMAKLTETEQETFNNYMEAFDEMARSVGLKGKLVLRYPHSDMLAVTMEVDDIFEQTPRQGTGNKI